MKLSVKEVLLLNGMRNNKHYDALTHVEGTWVFSAVRTSGMTGTEVRCIIGSLLKKGLVSIERDTIEPPTIMLTDAGRAVFNTANGEPCIWGGQPLLRVEM